MFIATLIAKERLGDGDISAAEDRMAMVGAHAFARSWLDEEKACDLLFSQGEDAARIALEGALDQVDVIVQPEAERRRRLLIADMDSTMIQVECIDELADYAGLKAEVAAITERAMRGDLDFEGALKARIKLLEGLEASAIDRCRAERVRLTPGARALVRTMRRDGAATVLVSGGFTAFADPVGEEIGFESVVANRLGVKDGRLTGKVGTPIVGAQTKRQTLLDALAANGLEATAALAVGDGANDIPMIEAAGLGVAYHAKPAAAAAARARIVHGDLTVLLYALGYSSSDWEAD
jgi:phosphoserine phosphatase